MNKQNDGEFVYRIKLLNSQVKTVSVLGTYVIITYSGEAVTQN